MSDTPRPSSVPATRAATTKSTDDTSGCAECLWPFGPDLVETWVLGRKIILCRNPWQCWGRQMEISERLKSLPD